MGSLKPKNLVHIVFNNGARDSVGGQPTVGLNIDFGCIARASGYEKTFKANTANDIEMALGKANKGFENFDGPVFIEIPIAKGARKDLGRPKSSPKANKALFMSFVQKKVE